MTDHMTTCRDCGKQFQLQPLLDMPQPTRCLECLIGLEARYATLEAELRVAGDTIAGHNRAWADRCEIAEAEVARLRAALAAVVERAGGCVCGTAEHCSCCFCIARTALAAKGDDR